MTEMVFTFSHHIKPYTRMTKRGKFVQEDAIAYIASQGALQWEYKKQMMAQNWEMIPAGPSIVLGIEINMPARLHGCDLSNQIKAIEDAANKIVWADDRYIDTITADRMTGPDWKITVFVAATSRN